MDPSTVIVILATQLICSGGLYYLIGRRMAPRGGLGLWALGAVLFGLAYLGRLVAGLQITLPWMLVLDGAMVLAALLFIAGLREFLGRAPARWPVLAAALLVYAAVQAGVVLAWGAPGRHVLLNLALGLLYAALALEALRAHRQQGEALLPPLLVLTVVMGLLAALTVARSVQIARYGSGSMYQGLFAQVYYAYASLAAVLLGLNLLWMVFARLTTQLAELASRDALTRVLNRNGLDEVVERHFAARDAQPLTLLQLDIDHFKRINDSHGHGAGDRVLRAVAQTLVARMRGSDFIARVGGEEFLVGCVGADEGVAQALAERLRSGVSELEVALPGARAPLRCTVSIGVARRCSGKAGWEQAWGEADRALYAAKAAGRNRVVAFTALATQLR